MGSPLTPAVQRGATQTAKSIEQLHAACGTFGIPNDFRIIERVNLAMNYLNMARIELDTAAAFLSILPHEGESDGTNEDMVAPGTDPERAE